LTIEKVLDAQVDRIYYTTTANDNMANNMEHRYRPIMKNNKPEKRSP
jgi:hypothetical protein